MPGELSAGSVGLGLAVVLASAVVAGWARRAAIARGVIDVPNERGSHQRPTPRGGGIGIVVAMTGALLLLELSGAIQRGLFLALVVGGGAVAAVGFLDDRHKLPANWRLAVHTLAALWAVYCVGGLRQVQIGEHVAHLGIVGSALAVLGVVWVLNLFNFMDGIDGIASVEALFVSASGALLALLAGNGAIVAASLVFGCACVGFLFWNWPPARVFLGDVGSGYLGYVVIVIALSDTQARPAAIWQWFTLGALFFTDSTLTLLRRLFRGDHVHQPHRQHAYQRLARRWGSHAKVTLLTLAIDLAWLLPLASLAAFRPAWGVPVALVATLPLLLGCWTLGAGRSRD
jgi:Fuc2NAc and GlcNAc transferase